MDNKELKQTESTYSKSSADSIIGYAKRLINLNLRELVAKGTLINSDNKGQLGQLIEEHYFHYLPNSDSKPDFVEVGLELKTSPLKTLKNGEIRAKERLVLGIINFEEIVKEDFETSHFLEKNAHLLLVFYLYDKSIHSVLDYQIEWVIDWKLSQHLEDFRVIKQDWLKIQDKIKRGLAHELSEGDTFYIGACTKGSSSKVKRTQPFNKELAKQRAFSIKNSYVNHILAISSENYNKQYGKIIKNLNILVNKGIEDVVLELFNPYLGLNINVIAQKFGINLNSQSKDKYAQIVRSILGVGIKQDVAEFSKAGIEVKTVRLNPSDLPNQHMSFPKFDFIEVASETVWEDSFFYSQLSQKFFMVFLKESEPNQYFLDKVCFWNMSQRDLDEVKSVWAHTVRLLLRGDIVKGYDINNRCLNNFPKTTENSISHIRPHARDSKDTQPLPVNDKITNQTVFTKQGLWLNKKYIRDCIYYGIK
jgi:DNA mismatch repair protein MutH